MDAATEQFKREYCEKCKDISPRPADWKYSDEWQEQENQRQTEFMARFYRKLCHFAIDGALRAA